MSACGGRGLWKWILTWRRRGREARWMCFLSHRAIQGKIHSNPLDACMDCTHTYLHVSLLFQTHASVVTLLKGVVPRAADMAASGYTGAPEDSPLALRLCATADGMDLVRGTDPVFSETLGRTLSLLRVFSFS